jgi:hypothetical protein
MQLIICFNCKFHEPNHNPQLCDCLHTGDGTQNLLSSAKACEHQCGLSNSSPNATLSGPVYSLPLHCALLAICCACDQQPFASVVDDLHRQEVELLRLGTVLPTSATVSNDVKHIYGDTSVKVAQYLQVCITICTLYLHFLTLIT